MGSCLRSFDHDHLSHSYTRCPACRLQRRRQAKTPQVFESTSKHELKLFLYILLL